MLEAYYEYADYRDVSIKMAPGFCVRPLGKRDPAAVRRPGKAIREPLLVPPHAELAGVSKTVTITAPGSRPLFRARGGFLVYLLR